VLAFAIVGQCGSKRCVIRRIALTRPELAYVEADEAQAEIGVLSPIVIHFFARSVGELGRLAFFLGSSVKSFVTEAFRVQSLV
jgi:hypothetical protein